MSDSAARAPTSTELVRSLVVLFPGCAYLEIAQAVARLRAYGDVHFVSPDGANVETNDGPRLAADGSYADASVERVRVVLVPGGDVHSVREDDALSFLLRRASDAGAVIGGICNGAILIARAGLVRGRRVTHTAVERYAPLASWGPLRAYADPLVAGSLYVDRPVVVDGALVTAKPWAAIAFASEVCVTAGLESPAEAAREGAYARGERVSSREPTVHCVIALRPGITSMTPMLVEARVERLRELDREGRLVLAGRWRDREEVLVVRVRSDEEARAIAACDPSVIAGARVAEVWRWELSSEMNAYGGLAKGPLAP